VGIFQLRGEGVEVGASTKVKKPPRWTLNGEHRKHVVNN